VSSKVKIAQNENFTMNDIRFPANVEMVSCDGKYGLMSEGKLPNTILLISTTMFSEVKTGGCWVTTTDTVTIIVITKGMLSHLNLFHMRKQRSCSRRSGWICLGRKYQEDGDYDETDTYNRD